MVRIEGKKLVIEIETDMPLNALAYYQRSLIDVLSHYTEQNDDPTTANSLGELLSHLMPSFEQTRVLYPEARN